MTAELRIRAFFDEATKTVTYLVWDAATGEGAVIDPVLDFDFASGEVDIGFQQMSELLHVEGIVLLGPLPDSIQSTTTFSAAMSLTARNPRAAQAFLSFLTSPAANPAKVDNGMTAA